MYIPHLLYSFISPWTFRLLPCSGHCKQYCNEHWGTNSFCFHITICNKIMYLFYLLFIDNFLLLEYKYDVRQNLCFVHCSILKISEQCLTHGKHTEILLHERKQGFLVKCILCFKWALTVVLNHSTVNSFKDRFLSLYLHE